MEIGIIALLVFVATVLLVVEVVFVPGFGVTGVAGGLLMAGSVLYAFLEVGTAAGWITLLVDIVICVALILWALYGKSLDKIALKKSIDSRVGVVDVKKFSVGDRGVARTRLALIGEAEINGEVIEVKSEAGFIAEGETIEVVRVAAEYVFVRNISDK